MKSKVVVDTNVLVAATRSRRGASFHLLTRLLEDRFDIVVSAPMVLEYEEVLMRQRQASGLSRQDVVDFVDSVCAIAKHQTVFYLWRPLLRDPRDDMILEVAVAGGCDAIVTFNLKDFDEATRFGIDVVNPGQFLRQLGEA